MSNIKVRTPNAKKIPNAPGIYIWRDAHKKPLYVGRAGSLKKRIASYFRKDVDPRIAQMVAKAASLSYETTGTLLEAIVLEAHLIKTHWPDYNVLDKDNRSFVYLVILAGEFPKPVIVRGRDLQKYTVSAVETFGPFLSYRLLRTTLELARKIFPFSTCQSNYSTRHSRHPRYFRHPERSKGSRSGETRDSSPRQGEVQNDGRGKPCFHYQIGLCPGVCVGAVTPTEYRNAIRNLMLFFRGEHKRLRAKLMRENPGAILALNHIEDVALLQHSDVARRTSPQLAGKRIEGYDISHFFGTTPVGAMAVFENGEPDTSQYRLFNIRGLSEPSFRHSKKNEGPHSPNRQLSRDSSASPQNDTNYDDIAMLKEVLTRRLAHTEWSLPDIVFVDGGTAQVRAAVSVLKAHNLALPVVGLAKGGMHSASSYATDRLYIANAGTMGKTLLASSRRLFQQVRDEAHRFSIRAGRRRMKTRFLKK
ncbi:GIY-YIG nuclease family protein [Candidatus Uhrbacteria bacterium]|nr:GIY-YIG nuclease family protein [Candidatus Uhrbacteria bacterium]